MKRLALVMLYLISSCSTWKPGEFEKDLDKPTEEVVPQVETTKKDEKLLEKFEVQTVEESKKEEKSKILVPPTKIPKTISRKFTPTKKTPPVETPEPKKSPFAKLPKEFISIHEKAKKVWDVYRPNHLVDEKVILDIRYLGMTVGKIMAINKGKKVVNDKEVWHFHARFKSAPFYSNIYELDDTVDTYVTADEFLSTRYSLIQRESKQDIDDLQLHDRDQFKTFWFYHQKRSDGKIKNKKIQKPIPYYSLDPFSVLFFFQGLPLKDKDVYEFPIINKGKILMLRSEVEGREEISTDKGNKKAIRVHAVTKYTGATLKSGDIYLWFSDDGRKTLLKAQAKIKIGSVTADIVDQ